jgi:REP element-mobilizing transposase RayT
VGNDKDNIPVSATKSQRPGGARENMSSTHLSLHCHVIFGTKHQRPLIALEWRPQLHAYIGGALRTLEVVPEAVGGVADHVHLLIGFRATQRLADIMRDVKRVSSAWVHETSTTSNSNGKMDTAHSL